MTSTWTLDRSREAILRLSRAGLDLQTFSAEALLHLRRAIGFDCWCLSLTDPDTHLPAGAVSENPVLATQQPRFWQLEFHVPDVNKHTMLIRDRGTVGLLSAATGGDMTRSPRWAELLGPGGLGDELRAPLMTGGLAWGDLALYRERSAPRFTADQARWVSGLISGLGTAARAAWAVGHPSASSPDTGPGTIVVTRDGTPVSTNAAARHWLDRLGPTAVGTICALTAKTSAGGYQPARVRLRTPDGQWLTMHASLLSGPAGNVAISVQPAHPAELVPLLMHATALSARERDIVTLILAGQSIGDIAGQVHISPHTVQDHLKAIYAKTGVHSRGELAVRMYALA